MVRMFTPSNVASWVWLICQCARQAFSCAGVIVRPCATRARAMRESVSEPCREQAVADSTIAQSDRAGCPGAVPPRESRAGWHGCRPRLETRDLRCLGRASWLLTVRHCGEPGRLEHGRPQPVELVRVLHPRRAEQSVRAQRAIVVL